MNARRQLVPALETPYQRELAVKRAIESAPHLGLGFTSISIPGEMQRGLEEHLRVHAGRFRPAGEIEGVGNDDPHRLPALVYEEVSRQAIWMEALRARQETWSGLELEPAACRGTYAYQRGTYVHLGVEPSEHVISSTLCLGHQLDGPWPFQIETEDGRVHQIDLEPGDLLLYEGARLKHGRPYPLDGAFYATLSFHYRLREDDA